MVLSRALTPPADPDTPEPAPPARERTPASRRLDRILPAVVLLAIAGFALLGIGSPLLGQSTFAATDEMVGSAPYSEVPEFASVRPTNNYLDDTWDSALPNTIVFADELREGHIAAWNPYSAGGVPLGATPNYALGSPLTLPFYALPGWFAPGIVKLLEIIVAVGGMYLFLRRLRIGAAPALLGGLVFASSAFMVVWTGWPQTRVAAFIPAVFWAVELIVQRARPRDAAVLALALAAMIFGGFPAVTGYTVATGAVYLVVRLLATHGRRWRRSLGGLALAAGGVAGGVVLTAVQLLPWVAFMSTAYVEGRGQEPDAHLSMASLVTVIAPWALGSTNPYGSVYWYLPVNLVESMSYLGAAALVLVVTAVAMARRGRAALPQGAWVFFVASTVVWLVLIYGGGFPLKVAQSLPYLFSDNFVGRARCVLGFLLAVLAALGLELLLRRRAASPAPAPSPAGKRRPWALAWVTLVCGAVAVAGVVALRDARHAAYLADRPTGGSLRTGEVTRELAVGIVLLLLALACAAALWWQGGRGGKLRLVAAVLLPLLVAGQALSFVVPYWPRSDKSTFYPVTDAHEYLREHLGPDRFAGMYEAMTRSAESALELRSATGHAFVDRRYGELIRSPSGGANFASTHVAVGGGLSAIASPTLDRMSVRYGVSSLAGPVPGTPRPAPTTTGLTTLAPDTPVTRPVPGTGPIRAVVLTPVETRRWEPTDRIEAVLLDETGRPVAQTDRRIGRTAANQPLYIPLAAEDVAAGARLSVRITVHAGQGLQLHAAGDGAAVGAVGTAQDGLKLAFVGTAAIFERTRALPRVRWAGTAVVEPDGARRLDLLRSGTLTGDQVVLEQRPTSAGGGSADVRITADGTDATEVSVTARGSGYLVLADPIQSGWTATVDGRPATLLKADHAFVAVAIPDGAHTVRFTYSSTAGRAGGWLSLAAALAVAGVLVAGAVRDRRRRALRSSGPGSLPSVS
ncbi:YfhO family protein [Phytohabitans sp. ZYX-F-186]|uniref:YfhO family protein n=1 Tax=Phytohabitans maris TaxID=3071409 RepID=A0ABU0ZP85_9ACTN|nr:YfhO family protein [Phytohabitans sp. ZYX-F-186]MDQ7908848.1 YfhO family protein [Phytohabitans sp. ZYX-F-186]